MAGEIYIVTGASGIAAATIKLLLQGGAHIFYIGKEPDQCRNLSEEIRSMELYADYIIGDLTDESTVYELVSSCIKKYGRIDGLFNVAGASGRSFGDGPLHECTLEGWQETLNINLTTQFLMCKYVLNQMLLQEPGENGGRGVILNMSSVLAFSPEAANFSAIAYATAKGAIISMTKTAAAFYAKSNIRINAIAPGLVLTRMSARASGSEKIVAFMETKQPLAGAVMDPIDVAKSAVFLLSDAACMITGETLVVDAGWSIS
ncbi:NAD(P)-dependent dehydrogenase (short-subunit alcohol dehydrogenase family) [Chitinophaga polysaccharea]|uniref:NAD(P)-dependent dehydrogenase (Short-subunit alcohol dehydrogenase family) n=1 Tax=Chitinophaga polysaccharea TaxID=1293035 RepID=A0A561PQF7_9BACT|nr:SDR family oxidoreductase [Chitinophaga polysaccharea]TWF40365.1 NAD(P)-dependent dehydrogenase (short-subunit alcohol dehydrogenase family) [Chitinophaga polysaccharea]